ncbi:CamS family sex pheromone protein [Ureibacillus thermophilus]|uniref:CamS family sex pheromone protein n=1 Tax=Ureibacillus thermophilus TaxID=367743 RepID=A0A4P6URE7_9BACL|nr:CamS family sex pheromone protein [Ureibacillus thermophilus]QBK24516.1 CamS family sex pheromone protein [Ureibacillus thermophilus]
MNRFRWIPAMVVVAMLAGCTPSIREDTEIVAPNNESEAEVETTIIPKMQLDESYYKTLIPYKESAARGLVVSNVYTKYDIKEAEEGLMRISQNEFSTDSYYFQEGQYLDSETVKKWLSRSNNNEEGLNPPAEQGMDPEKRAKEAPIYLAHIVEQNYLKKTSDNKVALGGISIGLALNSIYYYQKEQYGEWYEEPISQEVLEKKGKEIAEEVVRRLRNRPELQNVPILIALFKQEARNSIVPGTYFAYSVAKPGKSNLDDWVSINEKYVTFPMSNPEDIYRDMNTNFRNFKSDIQKYFSNNTSVIGKGFYQNNQLVKLSIEVPVQFYGTTEIIGFTQYLSGVLIKRFPDSVDIEVNITSINGSEALILKDRNDKEPFVHIYNY